MTRTCPQCERRFTPKRPHQIYDYEECRYQGHIEKQVRAAQAPVQRVETHPLQQVRDERATKKHNRDLGGLIKQAIVDQIKTTGECHADDLVDLYPEGEVDLCRRLATAQFGSMARHKLIRKDGWRPTKNSSRKGGGGWIWKFTAKGRAQLVGSSADTHGAGRSNRAACGGDPTGSPPVGTTSGEAPGGRRAGAPSPQGPGGSLSPDCSSTASPDHFRPHSSTEEQRTSKPMVPGSNPGGGSQEEGMLFDLEDARERPRSALTDPEYAGGEAA